MGVKERVDAVGLRGVLALPEHWQRRLAGRPVKIDGQVLATEAQLILRMQDVARVPHVERLPVPRGRVALRHQSAVSGGRQRVGSVREVRAGDLPARLYVPTAAVEPAPLLVFWHGGGFCFGDLDSHDPTCRFLAERAGVRVLSVSYRLAPEHRFPAAHDDAAAAYRWVVANTGALGADPDRLVVGGDSAGGNLAAWVARVAAREGLPLAHQVLVYPATDSTRDTRSLRLFAEGFYLTAEFIDLAESSYPRDDADRLDERLSPLLHDVPAGLAPAYVVTAGFDPLRDEGEAYAARLTEAGVPVEARRFADQVHGFLNVVGVGRSAPAAVAEVAEAVRRGPRP